MDIAATVLPKWPRIMRLTPLKSFRAAYLIYIRYMKKKIEAKPGDIIKIPLPDGSHTYARILVDDSYAFYDCKTMEDITDFEIILKKSILFCAVVDIFAIKERSWTIIGNRPLEGKLKDFYPRYFMPAPTNEANIGFYEVYKDEIEDAIKKDWVVGDSKTQLGGINGREHIEPRIMAYYEGEKSRFTSEGVDFFKKYLGLP